MRQRRGFTLLEVLIAVAITAMIGAAAAQLLRSVIDTKQSTDIRSEKLASLQRFNMVVSRDIEQFINRTIRDGYGDSQPSLRVNDGDYIMEFTRDGWRNSPVATDPRSELQRVAYRAESLTSDVCEPALLQLQSWGEEAAEGECLVRYFWPVLDRASDSEPLAQVVLEQIGGLEIELLVQQQTSAGSGVVASSENNWFASWPGLDSNDDTTLVPVAVRWRIELPGLGEIERLWLLAWGEF